MSKAVDSLLIDLYNQCNEAQQLMFRRMYSHQNLDNAIENIVESIPDSKKVHAISQCERTIDNNKAKANNET